MSALGGFKYLIAYVSDLVTSIVNSLSCLVVLLSLLLLKENKKRGSNEEGVNNLPGAVKLEDALKRNWVAIEEICLARPQHFRIAFAEHRSQQRVRELDKRRPVIPHQVNTERFDA